MTLALSSTPPMSVIVSTLVYLYIKISKGVTDRSGRHGILTLAWEGRKEGREEGRKEGGRKEGDWFLRPSQP